jgi:hypothetical protein
LFTTLLFKGKEKYSVAYLPEFIENLRNINFVQQEIVIDEAEFTIALLAQEAEKTVELYKKHGNEFSKKGIVNLFPIMLQNKGQLNSEKHNASIKLLELLESDRK